jgi:predicted RecB family nuclease
MTDRTITTELLVAHHQCNRKVYLLRHRDPGGAKHEYEEILDEREKANRSVYLSAIEFDDRPVDSNANVVSLISSGDLEARCDAIIQSTVRPSKKHIPHEPYLVVGTHSVTVDQKLSLAFAGYVVGEARRYRPTNGYIVTSSQQLQKVSLEPVYSTIQKHVDELREVLNNAESESPPPLLNDHCPICPFRDQCREAADKEDNLSRLQRMTPKLIQKYQKKGIFTVEQLSYVFKPRRRRKGVNTATPLFNVELQALALRTGKIYVDETPSVAEHSVEIYLDVEGIPDQQFDYLIGLVIKDRDSLGTYSLWADSPEQEKTIFQECVDLLTGYGDAPIYHYGSYDSRAFSRAAKKHGIAVKAILSRFVNVTSHIFGKLYFPAVSNGLKDLASLCGATWDSPNASGLQSLVWRYRWEESSDEDIKQTLTSYNLSDCHALKLLVNELRRLATSADSRDDVDFADRPKQISTERGATIHRSLEGILTSAHANYRKSRIKLRHDDERHATAAKTADTREGRYFRLEPSKVGKVIRVRRRLKCSYRPHAGETLEATDRVSEFTRIDLAFTKSGCRKTVTKYIGKIAHCPRCHSEYIPPVISRFNLGPFGHAFQAWAAYQRIVLRLPYRAITGTIEDLFGEHVASQTIVNFVGYLSRHYASTEKRLQARILTAPFLHIDETKLSIRGQQNYVWVLTDGQHVVFRLTKTREATWVHELLADYDGVVVSDFYGGYDGVQARQQKCLSHLIRDLNDDLWKNPFNLEFESFVSDVRELLVPIFDDVEKFGLKARNLRKHTQKVRSFYKRTIDNRLYDCEIATKYRKRFERYRDSLFLFLEEDGIPWNNNMAERAIRHLAVQRKISGSFYRRTATQYLRLLGIGQTCRFQKKSFLRFLVSGVMDVDAYHEKKRRKTTTLVTRNDKP